MKVEELRIGNIVLARGAQSVVKSIDENHIGYSKSKRAEERVPITLIKPILLTEEWLVKFSFDDRLHGWWSETIFLRNDENDYYYWFDWNGTNESKGVHIKHVHQLQNLYFALTGEELTIKK